jgi:predicted 3-demethylubiquinone-9 3-methyltransferase (glyoxalase superfamily)
MFVGDVCGKAEEAIDFYVSVFRGAPDGARGEDTKADVLARYGDSAQPDKEGTVQYAQFSLLGQEFGAVDSARAQLRIQRSYIFHRALRHAGGDRLLEGKAFGGAESRTVRLAQGQVRFVIRRFLLP